VLQIFKDPKIDFMKNARLLLAVSSALVVASVVVLLVHGLNKGIEFTGGTEMQVKYASTPNVGAIRAQLKDAGFNAQVTTIGEATEHEVYIRLAEGEEEGQQGDLITAVIAALRSGEDKSKVDLNVADAATIEGTLTQSSLVTPAQAAALASAITSERKNVAIFHEFQDLSAVPGMTPPVLGYLEQNADLGDLALRSQSYIGPAVGAELMNKTRLAIVFSLLMMMVYIWLRFQLQWGFAAVLALVHDTLITLGLFSLMGKEMSLPVVAAFLTLVGYSVNDTVVVFDRIRENVRNRVVPTFEQAINVSINQTLSRTVITSGLTWIVVFGLFIYGGPALNAFAFVLCVGVIVGTYSSIYIASPLLILMGKRAGGETRSASAPKVARRVKKASTS